MNDLSQEQYVSRVFVLPVASFDYLKKYQRALVERTGQQYNNSQVIAKMMAEHSALIGVSLRKGRLPPSTSSLIPPNNPQLGGD